LHLVGILFPLINDDALLKSHQNFYNLFSSLHSECHPYGTLSLNKRGPRFCFSVGNWRHFLGDVLPRYNHMQWRGVRRNTSCKIIFWPRLLCVLCVCVH